jgi:hypothetical protein
VHTVVAASLAAILLVVLGCRDLFIRKLPRSFTRIFQVSVWTIAALLFALIWTNPEHGATDPQILDFRIR